MGREGIVDVRVVSVDVRVVSVDVRVVRKKMCTC
jgi:hypothetical protein